MKPFDPLVKELLESVQTETSFKNVMTKFLELVEKTDFMSHCNHKKNDTVQQLSASALKAKLGIEAPINSMRLMHYPKFDFFHGTAFLATGFFQVFYFRREKIGLVSVVGPAGSVDYIRLSVVGESPNPSLN